jgi:hypothetical protein
VLTVWNPWAAAAIAAIPQWHMDYEKVEAKITDANGAEVLLSSRFANRIMTNGDSIRSIPITAKWLAELKRRPQLIWAEFLLSPGRTNDFGKPHLAMTLAMSCSHFSEGLLLTGPRPKL